MKIIMIIVAMALMLLFIGAAVALMPGQAAEPEPGTFQSESYIMAVDRERINICESWQPIDWNKVKVYDTEGRLIPPLELPVPCEALLVIKDLGDIKEIREIRAQVVYKVNDSGQLVVDRRAYSW